MIFKQFNLSRAALLVMLLIFAVSVLVRFPNINRPLSKHHEFVTSISLRVIQIWHVEGGAKYNFTPVMNYGGEANKNINNHASTKEFGVPDAEGNYYYLSHPPLAYIAPHFVFKVLNVKPTVLSLQVFHLFINFFSGILIYLLVINLKRVRARSNIDLTALIAFVIYTFSTAVLWFQCNTYMSDMFVHFFFLIGILLGLKSLNYPSSSKWKILFAINLFLMIYTSWLGAFFALVVFIFGLTYWRKKGGVPLAIYSSLAVVLALGLIANQYSSITGADSLIDHLSQRLNVRGSGTVGREGSFIAIKAREVGRIIFNYGSNYLGIILMILAMLFWSWKKSILVFGRMKSFIALSILPVLLLHLVLLNYSGQDFTVLYASCFLSIVLAFLIENQIKIVRPFALWFTILASVGMYYYINKPGDYSRSGERYDKNMNLGLFIKNESKNDEVVFLVSDELNPVVVVYAERNIVLVDPMPMSILPNMFYGEGNIVYIENDNKKPKVFRGGTIPE